MIFAVRESRDAKRMSDQVDAAELTIKDRLNFPYILANQILTFQKAILALEYSEKEIRETIEGFISLIPDKWKDDDFRKEMKKAIIKVKHDIRPSFCGVTASEKFCEQHGIKAYDIVEGFDYYKLFQCCINLLNRRGLLSKIQRVEVLEGIDFNNPQAVENIEQT